MKQMKIAKQIQVQRKQDKNRMVGQTFNPRGITSQQLIDREKSHTNYLLSLTDEEINKMYENFSAIEKWKEEENIFCSNSFEHNNFMRMYRHRFVK